jgi:hypothetical protein
MLCSKCVIALALVINYAPIIVNYAPKVMLQILTSFILATYDSNIFMQLGSSSNTATSCNFLADCVPTV